MSFSNSARPEGGRGNQERDHRQEVTNTIIKMLEEGVAPWQKPWEGFGMPYNPTSAKEYRGGNAVNLMASALEQGFTDPRWLTYRQAAENDWQVKKGEQGTRIEYWDVKPPLPRAESERNGSAAEDDRPRFIHKVYTVFNAQQVEGIPALNQKERQPFEPAEAGDRILNASGAKIHHDQSNSCFYNRATDSIHLTPKESFLDAPGYYGTALHELAHWSGHPSRLDRSTLGESYRFGDPAYAREELRAELTSLFISAQTGIPHDTANHAAYVGSWIQALQKDKSEIFRAAHDATAAADFILGLDRERSKEIGDAPEKETNRFVARTERDSGTVSVHDKRFGNDHHTPVGGTGEESGKRVNSADLRESFQEARELAVKELGQEARTYVAQTQSGIYKGRIIGETEHHLIQSLSGQTAVAHLKQLLTDSPNLNDNVVISYQNNQTQIREQRERSRTAELAR